MALTVRTYVEILNDMVNYVQTYTNISDFNIGSVVRTILEAAALEDDEQYFQIVQLLDLFSIQTATGDDLDRKLAEYDIFRLSAKKATGFVQFADREAKTSVMAVDVLAGNTSITVEDSTMFSPTSFPYTIRIGEGTGLVQDVSVTANNTSGMVLTLDAATPLIYDALVGYPVTLVTGAVSRLIPAGTGVEAPATVIEPVKRYITQEPAYIESGNIYSDLVSVLADAAGTVGNTGAQTITKFTGGLPFVGASVINQKIISNGTLKESDKDFKERGLNKLQSLSRGTPLSLKTAAIGVVDPITSQRVDSASIVEDFTTSTVLVYIDDGTGLTPDFINYGAGSLFSGVSGGDSSLEVVDAASFPTSGTVLIVDSTPANSELINYSDIVGNRLLLDTTLSNAHSAGTTVNGVDIITLSAEINQRYFKMTNLPIRFGTELIYRKTPTGVWTLLARDVDYIINYGTGEFQLTNLSGVPQGTVLVSNYTYYTNLIAQVQKILEGDPKDPINYPGYKAAGVFLRVEGPVIRRISADVTITAEIGYLESDLTTSVRRVIEDYINSKNLGEDIIISKLVDVAFNVSGVKDVIINSPTTNEVILENEKPIAFDSNGNSLITVS